jgi:hypothetical protein
VDLLCHANPQLWLQIVWLCKNGPDGWHWVFKRTVSIRILYCPALSCPQFLKPVCIAQKHRGPQRLTNEDGIPDRSTVRELGGVDLLWGRKI